MNSKTQRDHLSLSLATWGINDQNHYRDDDDSETAENDELLVGVLLILIGLCYVLFAFLQMSISWFHFL